MNPEIRRYIWCDLSPTRCVMAPCVLGFLFLSINSGMGSASLVNAVHAALGLLGIWGMGQAAVSVTEEVTSGTWDWQRLSPQGALTLTLGKIVGAPVFQWYCALLCLAAYFLAVSSGDLPADLVLNWGYHWVFCYIFLFSFSAINSVESARTLRAVRRPTNRVARGIFLLVVIWIAFSTLSSFLMKNSKVGVKELTDRTVHWAGFEFPLLGFVDISLFLFTAWAVFGCYRAIRAELQFRFGPWAWLAFLFFLTGFIAPLLSPVPSPFLVSTVLFGVAALGTYLNLLREDKDTVAFKRLAQLRRGEAFPTHLIPCWLVSLPVLLAALTGVLVFEGELPPVLAIDPTDYVRKLAVLSTLFVLRDGALLLSIHLRHPRHPRNDLAFLFYLFCLYVLIPVCLRILGGNSMLLNLFWPVRSLGLEWSAVMWALPLTIGSILLLVQAFCAPGRQRTAL